MKERLSGNGFGLFPLGKYKALCACLCGVVFMLFAAGGCSVNFRGQKRPLLRHDRIEGEVELIAEMDRSEDSGGASRKSKTKVFQERLNLRTTGDLYHPNLFMYAAGLGLGLDQQSVDSTDGSEKATDTIEEYSFSGTVLQKKPYSLSFALNKHEDIISRHFLGPLKGTTESEYYGLHIRNQNFPMGFSYREYETDQNPISSLSLESDSFFKSEETFDYNVRHNFSKYSRADFSFQHREGTQNSAFQSILTDVDSYDLSHDWWLGDDQQMSISSAVFLREQTLPSDSRNFRWNEGVTYRHSDTFETNYTFESSSSQREGLDEQSVNYGAGLVHRLYDSLRTSANVYGNNTDRQGLSEEDRRGGDLSINYTKNNRWGNIFADYRLDLYSLDRTGSGGTGIVDDEPHVVPFGSTRPQVTLREINVDETSIIVENGAGDVFTKNLDYTISTVGGKTRLTLNTLAGGAAPNFVAGESFFVDYTHFVESERTEDTVNQSFTLGQNFNNGLSLYFEHERQDEDITSSEDDFSTDDFTTNIITADYVNGGFSLVGIFDKHNSTQQDTKSTSLEARYNWNIDSTKNISVWGIKKIQDYGEPQARDVDNLTVGSEFYWRVSDKYSFTSDMSYVEENDTFFGDTKGFEFNSELEYKYRQFSFLTGLDYSRLTRATNETETLFVYMRIRRRF